MMKLRTVEAFLATEVLLFSGQRRGIVGLLTGRDLVEHAGTFEHGTIVKLEVGIAYHHHFAGRTVCVPYLHACLV